MVPTVGPLCLMAGVFINSLCGISDHSRESSRQLVSSLNSATIRTLTFQGQSLHPSLGLCGIPPALLFHAFYKHVLPGCAGVLPSPRTSVRFDLLPGFKSHLFREPQISPGCGSVAGASPPPAVTLFVTKQPLSLYPVMIHGFHQLMETRPHLI